MMPIIDIQAPAAEPIAQADVKASARIDGAEFDSQLAIIIPALRRHVEGRLGRRLINQTVELVLDRFPASEIDLQLPSVSSIVSVKYLDANGTEQTLASNAYALDSASYTAWLMPAYGQQWPETMDAANAVRVRFVVGYGAEAAAVPEDIRLWMIAHAVQILNAPDGQGDGSIKPLPFVDGLLDNHKVWRVV
jgi:uncharacterized phiE125 gp8 family phage protein